ncbi:MAG TPA: hypothetical protein VFY10_02450, partial [Dehalococcoidia bacterium]|nr:hypothetical protein [Dehalococcoidia bacterium]
MAEAKRDERGIITNAEDLTVHVVALKPVWCPACHEKVFQKWSGGWDGHAGWKCRGLDSPVAANQYDGEAVEARKREFK